MKNFIQPGKNLTLIATAVLQSGALTEVGDLVGVSDREAKANDEFILVVEGVFQVKKATSEAWTVGVPIYRDSSTGDATTTASGNKLAGHAIEAAGASATDGLVRLSN